MNKSEKLFQTPRWNVYQNVKVLKTKSKPTKEDIQKIKEFRKFTDENTKIKDEDFL